MDADKTQKGSTQEIHEAGDNDLSLRQIANQEFD
jgi:hypothetical protein